MIVTSINRAAIVAEARAWIGTPYRHQASLQGVGCDCLGLVRGVWRAVIGSEPEPTPPYSRDWAEAANREALADAGFRHLAPVAIDAFAPGDVLLFRWRSGLAAKHAAIVSAPDRMIHAHDGAAAARRLFLFPEPRSRAASFTHGERHGFHRLDHSVCAGRGTHRLPLLARKVAAQARPVRAGHGCVHLR